MFQGGGGEGIVFPGGRTQAGETRSETILKHRLAALVLIMALGVAATPAGAYAEDGGGNNIVVVTNTVDNAVRTRARVAIAHSPGDTVANQNVAVARATCTGCRTAAAAIQVVLIEGNPSTVTPANAAVALNESCNSCQTFAYANQVVFSPHARVKIGDAAEEQIEAIDEQAANVVASNETTDQMTSDLDGLTARLTALVQAEIQRAGTDAAKVDHREVHHED